MPIGAALGGILSAGISAAGGAIGNFLSYRGQKSANETNIRLAREARDYDTMMWNKQNEYNSPTAQRKRLKDAGLNPYLYYSGGTANVGNADSAPNSPVPQVANALADIDLSPVANVISTFQDYKLKQATENKIAADIEAQNVKTAGNLINNVILGDKSLLTKHDVWLANSLKNFQVEDFIAGVKRKNLENSGLITKNSGYKLDNQLKGKELENKTKDIAMKTLNNQIREIELELDKKFAPHGMHRKDPALYRKLIMMNSGTNESFSTKKFIENEENAMKNNRYSPNNYFKKK